MYTYNASKMYQEVPFVSYINALVGSEEVLIDKTEMINVKDIHFLTKLKNVLSKASPRVQAN